MVISQGAQAGMDPAVGAPKRIQDSRGDLVAIDRERGGQMS